MDKRDDIFSITKALKAARRCSLCSKVYVTQDQFAMEWNMVRSSALLLVVAKAEELTAREQITCPACFSHGRLTQVVIDDGDG